MSGAVPGPMVGPPLPGNAAQAGLPYENWERHTTKENIQKFFDPMTYKMDPRPTKVAVPVQQHEMITTPENIRKFFNPLTYSRPEKRTASPATPVGQKPVKMSKTELLEKFKLAATLNGYEWDEMAVSDL